MKTMTPNAPVLDISALKAAIEDAGKANTDTVEALRPFQRPLKAAGEASDIEDLYDNYIGTLGLQPEILLRIRSDMGGGRDFKSEETLILGEENRLLEILKYKHILFDEAKLRLAMKQARKLYGGRVRKDGSLFYTHALKTALLFAGHGDAIREDKIIIALLHDVIERGMANRDVVKGEVAKLQSDDPEQMTSLIAAIAPTPNERAAIKAGDVSTYFERIAKEGLLAIVLAEKLQNIHDGRRLFLTRPADERAYVTARLKPAVIRQYLAVGDATAMKVTLLTDYIDLLYLTETYDRSLDECVVAFLHSDKVSHNVEVEGLSNKLKRFKAFQAHNDDLNRILDQHKLDHNSAAYAHLRKAVTDAVLLLTTLEINEVFRKGDGTQSPVGIAIDRFMNRVNRYGSLDNRRLINSEHCAVLLNIIGYEIIEKAARSQRLVEGEEKVAELFKAVPKEDGVEEVRKAPGERIVTAGTRSDAVYLLLENDAYFSFPSDRGRQGGRIGPDNTISTTSVRNGRTVSATVDAGESGATLLRIPKAVYQKWHESNPELRRLLEETSRLRELARLRSERSPIANLDLVQCNTLREIIDVQDGWSEGTFDPLGNRTKRQVVFRSNATSPPLSFAEVSALVTEFEAEHLRNVAERQLFMQEGGVDSLSLLSKLRGVMTRRELIIEIDEQSLSPADLKDNDKVKLFMRLLEEMLTVETAKGREHRQAIELTLYDSFEKRPLERPANFFSHKAASGQDLVATVRTAGLDFIHQAMAEGFLYAANDPDNDEIDRFVTDLVSLVARDYAESIAKNRESFKTLIFSTLESMIVQQGGSLFRDEDAFWSFGTGANRLRGSNGIMHIIANWRRGKAILEALNGSYQNLARYEAIFCFATAWHDANAGSVQEANTGSRFLATGQSPDLKAGHGFAAVKYLEELRRDLQNVFGERGIMLIERLVARHDNGQLRFDTDEDALFSIMGISDNAASEEKTIEAFTKVPGNERVAVRLYDLFRTFKPKDKKTKDEEADEAMAPLRLEMESNIAEAFKTGRISPVQYNAYLNAIKADLTLYVGKLALESLGMHQSVSNVEYTDGVLMIHHTRSPLYAAMTPYLGVPLLQSRICDCVEPYKSYIPHLDLKSDLAKQDLSYQTGLNGNGKVREIIFKVEDAAPGTEPHDYTKRVYTTLVAGKP